jgi:G:T/U-mismatch repair DNA glycosylase
MMPIVGPEHRGSQPSDPADEVALRMQAKTAHPAWRLRSKPTHEKQHDKYYQDDADDADSAVTEAVAVAAEAAAETAKQKNDENDDEYQP